MFKKKINQAISRKLLEDGRMVRPLFIKSFWWGVQLNIEDTNIQRADKVNKIDDTLKEQIIQ